MKRKYALLAMFLTVFFFISIFILYYRDSHNTLSVNNGVLDLSKWKETGYSTVKLTGNWEFYWNELLKSEDINGKKNKLMVGIPSVWNTYVFHGKELPGYGYGTYHLLVKNAQIGKPMAIMVPPLSAAYRVLIDNKVMSESGQVSNQKEKFQDGYAIKIISFVPKKSSFHIMIQVSNYIYARGGLWDRPLIGTEDNIIRNNKEESFRDFFLIGNYLVMLMFTLILYSFQKKEKNYIYFAIICSCVLLRIIFNGYSFIQAFPAISNINYVSRVDYISSNWIFMGIVLLCDSLLRNEKLTKVKRFICYYNFFCTAIILLTPVSFFTRFKYFIQSFAIIMILYYLIQMIKGAIKEKRISKVFIIFITFFSVCSLLEVLTQSNYIDGNFSDFFSAGSFYLLLFAIIVMTSNYYKTLQIKKRTLEEMKEVKQKEYETELNFLKSQIRPHFIHNALNAIISISRSDANRARELLVDFSGYLRNCFDFENTTNLVTIEREIHFVQSYIAIEKARFGDKLHIYYEIDRKELLIPPLILQPLVENAVLHGIREKQGDGTIIVYVRDLGDQVCIGVKDDGIGIAPDIVAKVLSGEKKNRGIGLYNINQRLNKIYDTSLSIDNLEEGGTDIYMTLFI